MEFLTKIATFIFAVIVFLYTLLKLKNNTSSKKKPPTPSGSWPIIGHLHLLGKLPHISLADLADKYGSIFMIKLGVNQALVVSSAAMAKECLGTNDRVFVDRPQTVFVDQLTYNSAMVGFSPYGDYWRQMRKLVNIKLLSNHRLELVRPIRVSEISIAIKEIYDQCSANRTSCDKPNIATIDMKKWFSDISLNTTVRVIAGKSLKEFYQGEKYDRISKALREFIEFAGGFVPADALPFLKCLDIGGYEKNMKKVADEIDDVAREWLDEHKQKRVSRNEKQNQDFIDVLIDNLEVEEDNSAGFGVDKIIKATTMAMVIAATDTTTVTLTWALSLLLNNKHALLRTQQELDANVGTERQLNDSDLKNLIYLHAVIKETLRLYPAGPLSIPRESIVDCTVDGFHIPARTQLLVNLHKLHRDPDVWSDPLEFRPERFLTSHKDYDVRGQNFEYIPFGSGRRICPGISFALQFMQFTLGSLLHGFDMSTTLDEAVDMTEGFGLMNLKATPLKVTLIPRLSEYLYKGIEIVT